MELERTFYIIGIIYMTLGTILMLALVICVFAIKAKITAIHRRVEEKLHTVSEVVAAGEAIFNKAKDTFGHK